MQDFSDLRPTLQQLAQALTQRGWMLATAESCTGGLIAAACTDLPGSSTWFDRGFVTYSNAAKTEMLGVPAELIAQYGAVSEEVVSAMAHGAIERSNAYASIAISGIAGPDGGSAEKPVGTVWMAWGCGLHVKTQRVIFSGNRSQVRLQAVSHALDVLQTIIASGATPSIQG